MPSGMTFSPSSRLFTGTPRARFVGSCTYMVTDSAQPPATASTNVDVVVTIQTLRFAGSVPAIPTLSVGTSFRSQQFPAVVGGVAPYPYLYSFTCDGGALPPGTRFSGRAFSGRPSVPLRDSCTYTARDSSQPPATISGTVAVVVEGEPEPLELPDDVVPDNEISLEVGEPYEKTLRAATGGTLPYRYSFECSGTSLPHDMKFAPGARVLSGIPYLLPSGTASDSCQYSVTASDGRAPCKMPPFSPRVLEEGCMTRWGRQWPVNDPSGRRRERPTRYCTRPVAVDA